MSIEFKPGQYLLFAGNGKTFQGKIFSNTIKLANRLHYPKLPQWKRQWSHVAIIQKVWTTGEKAGTMLVAEALNAGFNNTFNDKPNIYGIKGMQEAIKKGTVALGTSVYELNNIDETIDKYLGAPYGWSDIYSIAIWTLTGHPSRIATHDARSIICSEAASRFGYDASGKQMDLGKEFNKHWSLITPLDMFVSKQIDWLVYVKGRKKSI